jgi:hypothetical protein
MAKGRTDVALPASVVVVSVTSIINDLLHKAYVNPVMYTGHWQPTPPACSPSQNIGDITRWGQLGVKR